MKLKEEAGMYTSEEDLNRKAHNPTSLILEHFELSTKTFVYVRIFTHPTKAEGFLSKTFLLHVYFFIQNYQ